MPATQSPVSDSVWLPTTSITRHRRIAGSISMGRSLLLGSFIFATVAEAAINLAYCSPENTGSDEAAYFWDWQSNGECYNHCVKNFAYGIILGKNCWCSNYAPLDEKPLKECSDPCPGYPDDKCGNLKLKYYNYIELPGHIPSSRTDGPASTTSTGETTTEPPTTSGSPTLIYSVTTILGSQLTITVTPTGTGSSSSSSFPVNSDGGGNFFSNTGRVAGVFIGIFGAIALIVGLLFFLRKRRKDRRKSVSSSIHPEMGMSGDGSPSSGGSASPNNRPRSTSTLGVVGSLAQEKSAAVTTTGFTETDRITDQRLDPNQIWMRFENDNSSRVSLRSLQDNQDYSRRVLKLTNPDA